MEHKEGVRKEGRRTTYRAARAGRSAAPAPALARTRPPPGWARRPSRPPISAWRGWWTRPGGPGPSSWRPRRPPRGCTAPLPRRPAPTPRSASHSAAAAGSRPARTSAAFPASSSRLPSPLPPPRTAQPPELPAQAESSPASSSSSSPAPAVRPGPVTPPWSPSWAPGYTLPPRPWSGRDHKRLLPAALLVRTRARSQRRELGIIQTHNPEFSTKTRESERAAVTVLRRASAGRVPARNSRTEATRGGRREEGRNETKNEEDMEIQRGNKSDRLVFNLIYKQGQKVFI